MTLPVASEITTERTIIRLVDRNDLPALLEANSDDEVTRYLPYASWKGMPDAEAWYERACAQMAEGAAWQFVILQRATGSAIGTCILFRFHEASARAEIGYVLARKYWGAGYMFEALRGVLEFAFERQGMRRLEAELDPRNVNSAKLLGKLGFVKEGSLRERWQLKSEITDSDLYGLLRADWETGR